MAGITQGGGLKFAMARFSLQGFAGYLIFAEVPLTTGCRRKSSPLVSPLRRHLAIFYHAQPHLLDISPLTIQPGNETSGVMYQKLFSAYSRAQSSPRTPSGNVVSYRRMRS